MQEPFILGSSLDLDVGCPLRVAIKHTRVTNELVRDVFLCKIVVIVLNSSTKQHLQYFFEALESIEEFDSTNVSFVTLKTCGAASRYYWIGKCKHLAVNVKPGECRRFALTACFSQPGFYNLNRFRFTLRGVGGNKVFYFPLQAYVVVG